jgi:predicted DNA-binding protein (MmcQ/YjbR family)
MSYFSKSDYDFEKFEKSKANNKKYAVLLKNKKNKKNIRLNFGDVRYQQYRDTTGLKLYSHLNHNDTKRRTNYRKRHSGFIKPGFYSPGYFSMNYLWD